MDNPPRTPHGHVWPQLLVSFGLSERVGDPGKRVLAMPQGVLLGDCLSIPLF